MHTVLYLPAGTFDPVKDPQSPHNRNLLVVQPVRKQRVSWICRPSDLVLVMVLVMVAAATLVVEMYPPLVSFSNQCSYL